MQVFYFFQFFTFSDYKSATVPGESPKFDTSSRYEVEFTTDFIDYLRTIKLPIFFVDESVELLNQD